MTYIFISYYRDKSSPYAHELADTLMQYGCDVWVDNRNPSGDEWERKIAKAVDECGAVIVIMTRDSFSTEWVRAERKRAHFERKPIFPILLEGEVFQEYAHLPYADVRDGSPLPDAFLEEVTSSVTRWRPPGENLAEQSGKTSAKTSIDKRLPLVVIALVVIAVLFVINRNGASSPSPTLGALVVYPTNTGIDTPTTTPEPPTPDLTLTFQSFTLTPTFTWTPSETFTPTFTLTPSETWTPTFTMTPSNTWTPTFTLTPSHTPTLVPFPTSTLYGGGTGEIAFFSDQDGDWDIYIINVDGTNLRNVTNNDNAIDIDPAWSPDGSQIAYSSQEDANFELYIMNVDGSQRRRLTSTDDIREYHINWSPDGQQIMYTSEGAQETNNCVMTLATLEERCFMVTGDTWEGYGSWSPDGAQMTYTARDGDTYEVFVMNADGTEPHAVTNRSSHVYDAVWSPDGRQIIYTNDDGAQQDIYIVNVETGVKRRMTDTSVSEAHPAWSPDGKVIVFDSDQTGDNEIYLMDARTGEILLQLTNFSGTSVYPSWRP